MQLLLLLDNLNNIIRCYLNVRIKIIVFIILIYGFCDSLKIKKTQIFNSQLFLLKVFYYNN